MVTRRPPRLGERRNNQRAPRRSTPTRKRLQEELAPRSDETLDSIGVGAVSILQKRAGYRFNLDPVLLSAFAATEGVRKGPVIDLGTGSGIIPILLARQYDRDDLVGLEIQPSLFDMAHRNVHLNRCEHRIQLALGDLKEVKRKFKAGTFGMVVANPPYGSKRSGRVSPTEEKAIARHEVMATLKDYVEAASWLLAPRGGFKVIYRAARLAELMECLCAEDFRPRLLRAVHPRMADHARLVMLEAVKGGREQLKILPPLVIHRGASGEFSDEVAALIGEAGAVSGAEE